MMARYLVVSLLAWIAWVPAAGAATLKLSFVGSGAEYGWAKTAGELPQIGGAFGCGQYNQGAPDCRLQISQQSCCHPTSGDGFDIGGQPVTITTGDHVGARGVGVFVEWQGICAQPPVPCDTFARWCKNGEDRRGGGQCTIPLPVSGETEVVMVFEGGTREDMGVPPYEVCGPNGGPNGTCGGTTTTTTPGSSTTTTLPAPDFKQAAVEQMRSELQQSLYPCLVATTGLVVFFTPPLAVGATAGALMISVATPACAQHVTTLTQLQQVYNDPPDPSYHALARVQPAAKPSVDLPSCDVDAKSERSACRKLQKSTLRWLKAVTRVTNVATALATTGNRYASAVAAGDARATKKQSKHASKLSRRLEKMRDKRAVAGGKVADILRDIGVSGALTAEQSRQGAEATLTQLALQGVNTDETRSVVGAPSAQGPIDILRVIASR